MSFSQYRLFPRQKKIKLCKNNNLGGSKGDWVQKWIRLRKY